MKFMSVWKISPENLNAAVERFKNNNPETTPGVKLVSRWHEVGTGKGFALLEVEDEVALAKFMLAWGDLVDQKVVPVMGDEEIAKAL
jgi:hypothetical protein